MDDLGIICDEIIDVKETNFTITLLIAVSIYGYLIKYRGKHLLPFHNTNNRLSKFYSDSINWKWII